MHRHRDPTHEQVFGQALLAEHRTSADATGGKVAPAGTGSGETAPSHACFAIGCGAHTISHAPCHASACGNGHHQHRDRPDHLHGAGHRTTHGEPFAAFDQLQSGDEVIVRTGARQFVYTLVRDTIVDPSDTWVVTNSAADGLATSASSAIITLVTCTPKWSTSQRWVWWGVLSRTLTDASAYR